MKKILSTFAFVLLLTGSAFAQDNLTANAVVVADLTITERQSVEFGNIANNLTTAPTINTDGTTAGDFASQPGTQSVGLIEVIGTAGLSVDVTSPGQFSLSDGGTETLDFTPVINWTNLNDDTGTPATLDGTDNTGTFAMTLDADGQNTLVIGGTIDNTGAVAAGTYTGTATVSISYQ